MNERIKKLMDESVRFRFDTDSHDMTAEVSPEDLEYFAELIVLECSRIAKLQTADNRVCDAIENHFGVE